MISETEGEKMTSSELAERLSESFHKLDMDLEDVDWNKESTMQLILESSDDEDDEQRQQSSKSEHVVTVPPETAFTFESLEREATSLLGRIITHGENNYETDDEWIPFIENEEHLPLSALKTDGQNAIYIHECDSKLRSRAVVILKHCVSPKHENLEGGEANEKRKQNNSLKQPSLRLTDVCVSYNGAHVENYERGDENRSVIQCDRELRRRAVVIIEHCALSSKSEREKPKKLSKSPVTVQDKKVRRDMVKKMAFTEYKRKLRARKSLNEGGEAHGKAIPETDNKLRRDTANKEGKQCGSFTSEKLARKFTNAKRMASRLEELTHEEREIRRKYHSDYWIKRRDTETPTEREKRLKQFSDYWRKRRDTETPAQREKRLKRISDYWIKRRDTETPTEREKRLKRISDYWRKRLDTETPAQREKCLKRFSDYWRKRRDTETPAQLEKSHKYMAEKMRILQANETAEQREKRLKHKARKAHEERLKADTDVHRTKTVNGMPDDVEKRIVIENIAEGPMGKGVA